MIDGVQPAEGTAVQSQKRGFLLPLRPLALVGLALLALWAYWWIISCAQFRLVGGGHQNLWTPAWPFIGLDYLHNHLAVRAWVNGVNVYQTQFGDLIDREYAYPPIMLPLFIWTLAVDERLGVYVWTWLSAAICAAGAWASWRTRLNLKLYDLSLPFVCAMMLFSTPVVFAMERGNCDVLVLLLLMASVWVLRREGWWADLACAVFLAVATWAKLYPLLLIFGLLALRRPRAFVLSGLLCVILGLAMWQPTVDWIERARIIPKQYPMARLVYAHSISGAWRFLWFEYYVPLLHKTPGLVGATLILLPLTLWGSWHVFRNPQRMRLAYPYLLWLAAISTFWFPISMDYKQLFLPLAVLAVWDVRDRLLVHAYVGVMLLWWQPFNITVITAWPLLLFKVLGLFGVSISLVARARELQTEESAAGTVSSKNSLISNVPALPTA